MIRLPIKEREDWQQKAVEYGFKFHTMYGEKYWDESNYYQFTLAQIEQAIEAPTEEIHQMCLHVVERVVSDARLMEQFCIPEAQWDFVRDSWLAKQPSLYSRLDFAYNGKDHAKLLENNADTPTSLYETGFWQWLWLEENVDKARLPRQSDQFNLVQEKLVNRFKELKLYAGHEALHLACCKDTEEDRGTVQYLQDCAEEAGLICKFVYMEDIGISEQGEYTDTDDTVISWLFKLYPWEFMFEEEYSQYLATSGTQFLEPPWKSILSNKALLPVLWEMFPNHPNLLPAFFNPADAGDHFRNGYVKKPIFSREGANISIIKQGQLIEESEGPYGDEGNIYQALCPLPSFGTNHTLIGSWLIDNEAVGISVREDTGLITKDLSRFIPHIILD